jgi:sigma-B regulation protein RsbU (phosphoserine phosphatase)
VKILIAEDDRVSRLLLEANLRSWGFEPVSFGDGQSALAALEDKEPYNLAILDWMMPGIDGVEQTLPYFILLTARNKLQDLVTALDAGADDFVTKPFDAAELRARISVGLRIVELQRSLANRIVELEEALANIKQLQGMLPICSYCKNIRADQDYWQSVESYIATHTQAEFSHSICPRCYETIVKAQLEEFEKPPEPTD